MVDGYQLTSRHLEWVRQALFALHQDVAQKTRLPDDFSRRLALMLREVVTADKRLGSARQDLQNIIWLLHGGVVMFDAAGTVLSANPAAEEILGSTTGELAGLHASDLFGNGTHPYLLELPESITSGLKRGLGARLEGDERAYTCNVVALQDRNGKPKSLLMQIEPPHYETEVGAVVLQSDESLAEALRRIDELERAYAQDRQRWAAERDATNKRHDAAQQLWSAERSGLEEDRDGMRAIQQHEEEAQQAQAGLLERQRELAAQAEARAAELSQAVEAANARANAVGQELEIARSLALKARTEEASAQSEQLNGLKRELTQALTDLDAAGARLESALVEQEALRQLVGDADARVADLAVERSALRVTLAAANERDAQLGNLKDDAAALATAAEAASEQLARGTTERDTLRGLVADADQRIVSLLAERGEFYGMLEAFEIEVSQLSEQVDDARQLKAQAADAGAERVAQVEQLEAKLSTMATALETANERGENAIGELTRERARLAVLSQSGSLGVELVAENRDLKARLALFSRQVAAEAEDASSASDAAELEASVRTMTSELEALTHDNLRLTALADESETLREANRTLRMRLDASAETPPPPPVVPSDAGGDDVSKPEMKRALRSARRETQTQRRRLVEALDAIQSLEVKLSDRDRALVAGEGIEVLTEPGGEVSDPLAPAFDEVASQLNALGRDMPSAQQLHERLTKLLSVSRASHRADQRQIETLSLALQTKSDEVRDLTADKLDAEELELRLQSALSEVARLQDRLRDLPPKGLTTTAEFDRPKDAE